MYIHCTFTMISSYVATISYYGNPHKAGPAESV